MAPAHSWRARAAATGAGRPRGGQQRAESRGMVKIESRMVVSAVASLYDDKLKPFGRILLKRVGERASADGGQDDGGAPPFVDARRLRAVCENCPQLQVEAQAGEEYVVLLRGRDPDFTDPTDARDPYPEALWKELAYHFSEMGEGCSMPLPAGRYSCARALMVQRLPCLAGRSLGEVCHVVALAVSRRRILGYSEGGTVPFHLSEARVKEVCAARQLPFRSGRDASAPLTVATWDMTRACISRLLAVAEERGGSGLIPVPNIKRLFRSQFQLELSETFLGHSRLHDLLNDPRLLDICQILHRGNVHTVARARPAVAQAEAPDLRCCAPPAVDCVAGRAAAWQAPAAIEPQWQGLLSTPGPGGAPFIATSPCAAARGRGHCCEQSALCGPAALAGQGGHGLGQGALWGQDGLWSQHQQQQQQAQWQASWPSDGSPVSAWQDGTGAECRAPECLWGGAFFDFLPDTPATCEPPRRASACSTSTGVSDASSGHASDTEMQEGLEGAAAWWRRRSVSSASPHSPHSPRSPGWELLAHEEFGMPAAVTKNTFIHISPPSSPDRARASSVPCGVRPGA